MFGSHCPSDCAELISRDLGRRGEIAFIVFDFIFLKKFRRKSRTYLAGDLVGVRVCSHELVSLLVAGVAKGGEDDKKTGGGEDKKRGAGEGCGGGEKEKNSCKLAILSAKY